MDPFVRASIAAQSVAARSGGVLLVLVLGAALVAHAAGRLPAAASLAAAGAGVLAVLALLVLRSRAGTAAAARRHETALALVLTLGLHAVVGALPGGYEGPAAALLYVFVMAAAALAHLGAALAVVVLSLGLEALLGWLVEPSLPRDRLLWRAALSAIFATGNLLLYRAEIARVRRASRQQVTEQLRELRDAARAYRLTGGSTREPAAGDARATAERRRLVSGVTEIHESLSFGLRLLRSAMAADTAALLWLEQSGRRLVLREAATDHELARGPFPREGMLAAALNHGHIIALDGARAARHAVHLALPGVVGALCVVPILEGPHPRGVLLVNRLREAPFTDDEQRALDDAAQYFLRVIDNERVFLQLERAKHEQARLYRAVERLAAATTEREVIEAGVQSAREFTSFNLAIVTLFDEAARSHEICAVSGHEGDGLVGQTFKHNAGLVSMVVANRHALPYRGEYDAARQTVFAKHLPMPQVPSLLVLPLLVHDRPLGTLVLGSRRRHAFGEAVRPTLEVLASHVAVSLANARMMQRLEELATTDGLTRLLNKRYFQEQAAQKLKSAKRFQRSLAAFVCDINHFKKVNDTYGHDVGDVVIKGLGDILRRAKRDTDIVGRFGGEEFVVLCEETTAEGAALLANRVRRELEATTFHGELGPIRCTLSAGVAATPKAGEDWDALFKSADEALYESKRGGRNRVTVAAACRASAA